MKSVTLTFPLPTTKKTVHGNGGWRGKFGHVQRLRSEAKISTLSQTRKVFAKARIKYRFAVPDRIRRDEANLIQACKPIIDGIVDARCLAGDDWQRLSIAGVETFVDKDNPRVEIVLEELE
jgi:hypothetical protein